MAVQPNAGAPTDLPPANESVVVLLGELNIDEKRVTVGVVSGEDTLVQLDRPAAVGNALTIGSWLNDAWGTKVDALVVKPLGANNKVGSQRSVTKTELEAHLKKDCGFPDQIAPMLADLFTAEIVVTDLYARIWKERANGSTVDRKAFKLGIAVDFATSQNAKGLQVFGDIYLQNVKLGILNAPKDYDFDAHKLVLPSLRLLDYKEAMAEVPVIEEQKEDAEKTEQKKPDDDPASSASGKQK